MADVKAATLALWGLLLGAGGPAHAVEPAAAAPSVAATRLADSLRQALGTNEPARLRPLLPGGGPVAGWVAARWRTRLPPGATRTWGASFEPFYETPVAMGGLLTLTHQAPGEPEERASFGVEAWSRARGWVVGDPLPLERPELEVASETLHLDLREPSRLRGEARLELRRRGPETRLFLRLSPASRLRDATLAGRALPARQLGPWVYVGLPAQGAALSLELRWEGEAPAPLSGRRVRRWGAEEAWHPRLPGGAPHPMGTLVMAPPGWAAVAAGAAGERTPFPDGWLYRYDAVAGPEGWPLWLGDWPSVSHSDGRPRIEAWTGTELEADAERVVREAGVAADHLAALVGGYPLERIAFGEGLGPEVPGQAGLWLLDPESFRAEPQRARVVPRAVAVSCVAARGAIGTPGERAWLQAALPDYLAALLAGRRQGPAGLRAAVLEAYRRYDGLAGRPGDEAIGRAEDGPDEERWRRLTQDKGLLVWHMLARTTGPEAFARALRALLGPGASEPLGVAAVQRACERASGKALGPFFRQWLGREGRPRLALQQLAVRRSGAGWEVRGRLVQEGEPFSLTVPLVMTTDGPPRLYEIALSEEAVGFVLKTPHRPGTLRIDPLHDTLAASAGAAAFDR